MASLTLPITAHAQNKVTYDEHVSPILREHCFACHNQDDPTASLALDSFEGLTTGGAGGEIVTAGDPSGSRLWKLVTHEAEPKMPPGDKLPDEQLNILRDWIKGGLLKNAGSKPLQSSKPAVAKLDADNLGKPVGEPAMPEQLYHEPVLWTPKTGPLDAIATSPWAPLAAIAWQRQISFYDTNSHELLGIVPYVDGVPRVVKFSRDGSLVLVAGGRHAAAGSASLFDVKTGDRLVTLGDELDIVLAADISSDLSLVALGGPKKKVRVYRVADGSLAYQINKHTEWITALGFSPDGRLLATADRNGGALLWQATAGHERADLRGHKATITSLDWRRDSAMLATASEDGTVRLWNPAGKQIKSVEAHKPGVLSVRFAQDGNWVTTGRDQNVKSWKADGSLITDFGQMPGISLAAAFTHDGKQILASDYSGEVRLYDVESKQLVTTLQANPQRLAQRLSEAEQTLQLAQQAILTSEDQQRTQLTTLDAGKAAHAAHQAKLANTQQKFADKQSQLEQFSKAHSDFQQQLAAAHEAVASSAAIMAEAQKLVEQTQAAITDGTDPGQLEEVKHLLDKAKGAHASARKRVEKVQSETDAAAAKQQATAKTVQELEALVAQVSNETAGLPDLEKLAEQHKQAEAAVVVAKQQLSTAQTAQQKIATQQTRFIEAKEHFASQILQQQTEQQKLAQQAGHLEAEHELAAKQLTAHRQQLSKVAEQMKSLQAQLEERKAAAKPLQSQEDTLAAQLKSIQSALQELQNRTSRLEATQRDFLKSEQLRGKYTVPTKVTTQD